MMTTQSEFCVPCSRSCIVDLLIGVAEIDAVAGLVYEPFLIGAGIGISSGILMKHIL